MSAPPPIIDSARVLQYAVITDEMDYTDRIHLYVEGERVGRVPNLAICQSYRDPRSIVLLFCDTEWDSLGCIGFTTVDEAERKAERGYPGVAGHWNPSLHSQAAIDEFLRDIYEVDPRSEWWRFRCSFCQRDVKDAAISKGVATICIACVDSFHKSLHENA